jgi:P-type Cu+ transporter
VIKETTIDLTCYHCGQPCPEAEWLGEKPFCCFGCKTVYEILSTNNLCEYYTLDKLPGIPLKGHVPEEYAYLDDKGIYKKVIEFDSDRFAKVRLFIPAIHCVSCIWLLENLHRIDPAVSRSEVNFSQKTVVIDFNPQKVKLSQLAGLLDSLGYRPSISLEKEKDKTRLDKSLVLKLSVAGFCFGNVMLFSFPEYLGIDHSDYQLQMTFSFLNLFLALPVIAYSASDYFKSALLSFKQKQINIDVPIAVGLLALFLRSSWDILTQSGPGYLDSFTGLVFFLLIGRWFQGKTYETLAFDRDFKSYFPLAVSRLIGNEWQPVIIYALRRGDQIKIRNMEIIPADSILLSAIAYIDYSFVTGEAKPEKVGRGSLIYAGGRLIGQPITLKVKKQTSQSHLTSLWNHEAFRKREENKYQKIIDAAARKFTWIVLGIAAATAVYWQINAPSQMWLVLTSVLMVACPCALALAAPFTYGSMLRVMGRNQLYLKNTDIIERMAGVDAIVFDKTGTLTYSNYAHVEFNGNLEDEERAWVKLLTSYSSHPLSIIVSGSIKGKVSNEVLDFKELPGMGIEGVVEGAKIKIGSEQFVGFKEKTDGDASKVFVSIDDEIKGYFIISVATRENIAPMIQRLGKKCVALLSGDQETNKSTWRHLFSSSTQLLFNQSPHDKLEYIRQLQVRGLKVMMIGDGLNDAGAMKQSDVGISVADDTATFTPASDGILKGDELKNLDRFISLAKSSSAILKIGFAISFLYNATALSFAVSGHLTPLVAAILMPMSSVSVVGFSTLAVNVVSHLKLKSL